MARFSLLFAEGEKKGLGYTTPQQGTEISVATTERHKSQIAKLQAENDTVSSFFFFSRIPPLLVYKQC